MRPEEYLAKFHDIMACLDDNSIRMVKIRRYVSGTDEPEWGARIPIINGMIAENPGSGWTTSVFTVDKYYTIQTISIVRAYTGKGSPTEIGDAIWLAHRYGEITNPYSKGKKKVGKDIQQYIDDFIGLDCNGFVGNYFGLDPNRSISAYVETRRKSLDDVQDGDVLVWYRPWLKKKKYGHIGLIDTILDRNLKAFRFKLVDWGSGAQSKHVKTIEEKLYEDKEGTKDEFGIRGALYYLDKEGKETATVFVCAPPGPPKPKL